MIQVRRTGEGEPLEFELVVREGQGETHHHVTMTKETWARWTAGKHTPRALSGGGLPVPARLGVEESILSRFDVTVISRCFPEFERELLRYISRS